MDSPDPDDDLLLIQTALDGDARDFEPLVRRYGLRVYAAAFAVLQNREEAEDAAQDAFCKAYQSRRKLREPERFGPWLLAIARNQALDRLRKRKTAPPPSSSPDAADWIADESAPAPDRQLDAAENHARIRSVLATLPERHRLALTLRYLEGLDCRSIEQTMSLSNGALRGILGRALAAMREGLRLGARAASLEI